MQKSWSRTEKKDDEYEIEELLVSPLKINLENAADFKNDKMLLVYESELNKLLCFCSRCGKPISGSEVMKDHCGTQHRIKMTCLDGCDTEWSSSQPSLSSISGKLTN